MTTTMENAALASPGVHGVDWSLHEKNLQELGTKKDQAVYLFEVLSITKSGDPAQYTRPLDRHVPSNNDVHAAFTELGSSFAESSLGGARRDWRAFYGIPHEAAAVRPLDEPSIATMTSVIVRARRACGVSEDVQVDPSAIEPAAAPRPEVAAHVAALTNPPAPQVQQLGPPTVPLRPLTDAAALQRAAAAHVATAKLANSTPGVNTPHADTAPHQIKPEPRQVVDPTVSLTKSTPAPEPAVAAKSGSGSNIMRWAAAAATVLCALIAMPFTNSGPHTQTWVVVAFVALLGLAAGTAFVRHRAVNVVGAIATQALAVALFLHSYLPFPALADFAQSTVSPVLGAACATAAAVAHMAVLAQASAGEQSGNRHNADDNGTNLFYVAAALTGVVSLDTSWRFFGERIGIDAVLERAAMFTVLEVMMLACGVALAKNVRNDRPPGPARVVLWGLQGVAAYMAVSLSGFSEGIGRVALGPGLGLIALHLALGIEIRARSTEPSSTTLARVFSEIRERALAHLGLDDTDRDAAARRRDLALHRSARVVSKHWGKEITGWQLRKLTKSLVAAGVSSDPARAGLLETELGLIKAAGAMGCRDYVSPLNPDHEPSTT